MANHESIEQNPASLYFESVEDVVNLQINKVTISIFNRVISNIPEYKHWGGGSVAYMHSIKGSLLCRYLSIMATEQTPNFCYIMVLFPHHQMSMIFMN
jgi:hypothetical protein